MTSFHRIPCRCAAGALLLLLGAWTPPLSAAEPDTAAKATTPERCLRITKDKRGRPLAMETAILHCTPLKGDPQSLTVDLIGAVHIAEKSYYQQLNKAFEDYDVVLYELVAAKDTRIAKGQKNSSSHPVSMLQQGMKEMLQLEFQLEAIDYTAKNFVHADMSPEQFTASMKDRNESFSAMLLRMMGYAMARQQGNNGSDMQLLMALFDKDRSFRLKQAMAEQFEDMEGSMMAIEGPDGSTLIAERNKVALSVLKEQIAKGKKKIAVFYGAGHLPDFVKRLRDDFALAPTETRWLQAWDLKAPPKPAASKKTVKESAAAQ